MMAVFMQGMVISSFVPPASPSFIYDSMYAALVRLYQPPNARFVAFNQNQQLTEIVALHGRQATNSKAATKFCCIFICCATAEWRQRTKRP